MSCVVTKSPPVLVGPSEPTPPGNLALSSFDKALVAVPITSLHVFEHGVNDPINTIRRALSQALVPYHPIAGRFIFAPDCSEPMIACTGEGIKLVAASASCALEDVKFLDSPLALPLDDLAVAFAGHDPAAEPMLLVQVTEFSCGGFVVGVTWRHVVADAIGMAQFLLAVGALARGLPPPVAVPVRYDSSLPGLPPVLTVLGQAMASCEPQDLAYSDVTVPSSYITRVKAALPCTTFEVVTATVWQCRVRAIGSHPELPAPLVFAADVRKHVHAKRGYYGNCGTFQPILATSGAVASADVRYLVKLIQAAKAQVPSQFTGGWDGLGGMTKEQVGAALCGYGAVYASCWGNLGFEGVDYGGGAPARVMYNLDAKVVPSFVPCLPCRRKDGANVMAFCVKEEHAAAFHGELARLYWVNAIN